jgi:inorganic triphosphatase YgiF
MTEVELKLMPRDGGLLDRLARAERLGTFEVVGRRHERQHNSFFDTSSQALRQARIGFRRRIVEGEPLAVWTLKADARALRGVTTRTEIERHLSPELSPERALDALREDAPAAFVEQLDRAFADGSALLPKPYLETATDRRILDLRSDRAEAELALDRMTIPGHDYAELEIEVELKHGDEAELDEARKAIEALGEVRESEGSKLSRATDYVERNARSSR